MKGDKIIACFSQRYRQFGEKLEGATTKWKTKCLEVLEQK